MRESFVEALKCKYEAEIAAGKATARVYFEKPVAIGEHPQFVHEIDKQLEIIGCAQDKLRVLDKYYPSDDDIPF